MIDMRTYYKFVKENSMEHIEYFAFIIPIITMVISLFLIGVFAYVALRFVRSVESIADSIKRMAEK